MLVALMLTVAALLFWMSASQPQNAGSERHTGQGSAGPEPRLVVLVVGTLQPSVVVLSQGSSAPSVTVLNVGPARPDPLGYYESQMVQTQLTELHAHAAAGSSLAQVGLDPRGAIRLGTDSWA